MKATHIWSVACKRSAIDQETNNVSLFEIIEELGVQVPDKIYDAVMNSLEGSGASFPFDFQIVSLWEDLSGKSSSNFTVSLRSPSGNEVELGSGVIDFQGKERMRQVVKIAGLTLKEFGRHEFIVKQISGKKDKIVAKIPVVFKIEKAE